MANLVAKNGPKAGKRYELSGDSISLGRHPDCPICIPEVGAVSRFHAKITVDSEKYFVEDLESRNGTQLNGETLVPHQRRALKHGDTVRICDVEFGFEVAGESSKSDSGVTVLVDDQAGSSGSTIMSKLEVPSGRSPLRISATPEARLAAMIEIVQSLGKALGLDAVLEQILVSLFKIFVQADRGFIVLRTDSGALVPRWTKVRRERNEETLRISRTIINKVIDSREAILSADASSDTQFAMSQSIADFRIRSMMCAPLVDSDGIAFGALQIDTLDQRTRFQEKDLELLASIASQVAIAIDKAQLHENALRQRAMERDLKLAFEVQKGFLPERPPNVEGYSAFHYYQPANQVGGDYFDYIRLPDGRLAVIIADVVGHGVAAALMMAKLSAETRYCLVSEHSPAKAITELNNRISGLTQDRFVTMVIVIIDPSSHQATIVNAGHMAPIIRRANGSIEEPGYDNSGLPLGLSDGYEYEQSTISMERGDLALLYTDGINESSNPAGELFGIERLRKILQGPASTPHAVGQLIINDVRDWIAGGTQDDDMCLVCFARLENLADIKTSDP